MSISEIFIRRPIATSLLMMGILVFGAATYGLLPVAALPTIDFPTITVSAKLPGASPDTMASSVATPLEQEFAAIPGLTQMTSTSGVGATTITLQFALDRNIDGAAEDVQTAINAAGGLLPKDLPNPPTYKKTNPTDRAVLIYAVYSDALPIYKVDDYAYTVLAQKLSTVSGVSQVIVAGQQQYAAHVQVNPTALAARGISLEDVRNALAAATTNEPKGNLEGKHQSFTLDTNDQLFNANAFRNVIVAYRNGAPVKLQDIGDLIDSSESPRTGAWYNSRRAELLLIERQPGANTLAIVDQIKAMMPQLEASIPPSVHVDLISDRSDTIRASVRDVQLTLLLTIGLVVMVIFAFLRSTWATIIPSVTVPLALIGTFGVMYLLGHSLDNLSLMALTVATGFVVDDAIVVVENITRHIEAGMPRFQAAILGAREVGFTVLSMSLSLVAVFIPILLMGGIVGRYFREFAMVLSIAIAISLMVSLTTTPMMCAYIMRHRKEGEQNRFSRWSERFFEGMLAAYDQGLRWALAHARTMMLILAGVL